MKIILFKCTKPETYHLKSQGGCTFFPTLFLAMQLRIPVTIMAPSPPQWRVSLEFQAGYKSHWCIGPP